MPEALNYIVDTNSLEFKELETAYAAELQKRMDMITLHWDYYQGQHKMPLKPQSDKYDDNIVLNQIDNLADRITDFMLGDGIFFRSDSEAADEKIAEAWQSNSKNKLLSQLILGGTVEGHLALLTNPVENGVKLTRVKQKHFGAFYDPFDISNVLWYRLQHKVKSSGRRIDYVKGVVNVENRQVDHSRDDVWTILTYGFINNAWKIIADPFFYEFPIPPIVDWQNKENLNGYYGFSDVSESIKLNDALNFILSNMQRIIKHWADPKTIGIGFTADELINTQVGGFFSINKTKTDVDVFNLEMQSDLMSSSNLADKIFSAIWHSGKMVDPQSIKDQVGQLTNFGLRVLFNDAVKATDKKRTLYEEGFEQTNFSILNVLRETSFPSFIETIWSDILPQNAKEEAETLTLDLANRTISKQTYREERGYNHTQEEERIAEEAANDNTGLLNALNGQLLNP